VPKLNKAVTIAGTTVGAGERADIDLRLPDLYTHTEASMPITVINGRYPGPRLFVSAVIHGDELNGMEVVRRLLQHRAMKRMRGTLLAIPIVNVFGCLTSTRYLPDGRDLNRMFPGISGGSMGSRIAHLFMEQIVRGSDYGVDLHTGARHRANLPHVRTSPEIEETHMMARAFGAPLMIDADLRDGSLRHAALAEGIPILLYEAGEALRFDEVCIRAGVTGVIGVMRGIGMLPRSRSKRSFEPMVAHGSSWERAPASGVVRMHRGLGDLVESGQPLGEISDPLGTDTVVITARRGGIIIGASRLPLVHEGEALFNIAQLNQPETALEVMETFDQSHHPLHSEGDGEEPIVD
jgi:predicted deacylase